MKKPSLPLRGSRGFTLVELLVVMAIIAILAGLTLSAAMGALKSAARKRATAEIQAMSTALESYKTDNGAYPPCPPSGGAGLVSTGTSPYYPLTPDPGGTGQYATSSNILYTALSGCSGTSATTTTITQTPSTTGARSYMTFKGSQIALYANTTIYIQDPFHYSYGYSTGNPTTTAGVTTGNPVNGANFFDLWSTGGTTGTNPTSDPGSWITNWSQ